MTNPFTIALAQQDFTVGDLTANADKIIATTQAAAGDGADLVVFPEMAITGYPAEDILFKGVFQQAAMHEAERIANALADCSAAALVGGFWVEEGLRYNCAFLIDGGEIIHRHDKHWLPNYGVFDEKRLFRKGDYPQPVVWRGHRLGVLVCEDLWKPGVARDLKEAGAELLISMNASPFELNKDDKRRDVVRAAYDESGLPIVYLNLVGGQDELVFDGRSFAIDADGNEMLRMAAFEEEVMYVRCEEGRPGGRPSLELASSREQEASAGSSQKTIWPDELTGVYQAMVLGLRDYVNKNGFKGVVIDLSGGIDSGLTAAVAVDALGSDRVQGLIMPSPYTSDESIEDAEQLAQMLNIKTHTIAITDAMQTFGNMLAPVFEGTDADTTEENIQARIRGNLLMAMSNKLGFMVLTTGNKSEMSVGYATLYGDMCGGYSVLKDVYKMMVFALSHWRNDYAGGLALMMGPDGRVIPERMITKPPSAELKPNQKDEDSLPPYELLDAILHGLIEERLGIDEMVAEGYDEALVERISKMIYIAEYKRRQSPPGVKISGMSFGRDRRYPITNKWIWQRK